MHSKGQIFSTDLLFGVILLLFGVGLLMGAAEINTYNQNQRIMQSELIEKTIIGLQVISNSADWDCSFEGTHAAYSINKDVFLSNPQININTLKNKSNLEDYKIRISLDGNIIFDEIISFENSAVYDTNVLLCTNSTQFSDLRNCMNTSENCRNEMINRGTLSLMVAK